MTLTTAWSHKRRLVGTAAAILLGVAFLAATLVVGDSARAGFSVAFEAANDGTDAYVRSSLALTSTEAGARPPIDEDLLSQLAAVEGVRAVAPTVEGIGQVLDADGSPLGGGGPPSLASAWVDDPTLTPWDIVDGVAPDEPGEVVVDRQTAADAGVAVGDRLTVLVPQPVEAAVVGIAAFGDDARIGGATYVAFSLPEAQRLLLGGEDLLSGVIVSATDGATGVDEQQVLVDRLRAVLPSGVEAVTGAALTEEMRDDIESDFLGFFTTALLAFAAIALVVAAFSIFNTFSILAAQRARDAALLRALGASRSQVLLGALVESVIVGIVGAAAGTGVGVLLATGLLALMEGSFGLPLDGVEVAGASLPASFAVGAVVTVLGGLLPAWRSSRVRPVAALREVAVDTSGSSRVRTAIGGVTAGLGVAVVAAGGGVGRSGLGAIVLVVGAVLLGPAAAGPAVAVLGAPLRWRGISGELARRNAVRNPRRTAATASALLIGVGVVSLFAVFGASVTRSLEDVVDRVFAGDLAVTPAGGGFSGADLSVGLVDDLGELPEIAAAAGLGYGPGMLDGRQQEIGFSDPAALDEVARFEPIAGDVADVGETEVALADDYADTNGHDLGDELELGFADGTTTTVTVAAIYDPAGIGGDVLVHESLWVAHNAQPGYYLVMVDVVDDVDLGEGRAAVEAAVAGLGAPEVMDRDEFVASEASEVDTLLTVIYALLAVAIVIATIGIANTMSLSLHERTAELGLLRAVGQSRSQVRAMVRLESVVVAVFGTTGGIGLGLFLSWGLVRALNADEGWGSWSAPVGTLLVVFLLGAAAGVLAGLRPAWRASRLDVLDAVAAP